MKVRLFPLPMLQIRFSSLDVPHFFHYCPTKYQIAEVPKSEYLLILWHWMKIYKMAIPWGHFGTTLSYMNPSEGSLTLYLILTHGKWKKEHRKIGTVCTYRFSKTLVLMRPMFLSCTLCLLGHDFSANWKTVLTLFIDLSINLVKNKIK